MTLSPQEREWARDWRHRLKEKAAFTVMEYWKFEGPPCCFGCGDDSPHILDVLTFDHLFYAPDSVKNGRSDERHREAIAHPDRFQTLCRTCHQKKTVRTIASQHLTVDATIGDQRMTALRVAKWLEKKRQRMADRRPFAKTQAEIHAAHLKRVDAKRKLDEFLATVPPYERFPWFEAELRRRAGESKRRESEEEKEDDDYIDRRLRGWD